MNAEHPESLQECTIFISVLFTLSPPAISFLQLLKVVPYLEVQLGRSVLFSMNHVWFQLLHIQFFFHLEDLLNSMEMVTAESKGNFIINGKIADRNKYRLHHFRFQSIIKKGLYSQSYHYIITVRDP